MHLLLPLILSALCFSLVSANTEIVNFDVSDAVGRNLSFTEEWYDIALCPSLKPLHNLTRRPVFSPQENEGRFDIVPAPLGTLMKHVCAGPEDLLSRTPQCPHEIWLKLDLDQDRWISFSKFTLRISWPASSPADFSINIYNPEQVATRFQVSSTPNPSAPDRNTRTKYARIRLVDTGVRTPMQHSFPPPPTIARVPFMVIVEPLYLGVIPASVLPVGTVLAPLLAVLFFVVPRVNSYIEGLASAIGKDLKAKTE
ncbi:hypothetical protein D9758_002952 [Tetrapyrgos nigripes]|uniref:Uncharacterized protein n=1 Tax=Tetrapyrgos nigripes TaxID=182062 RepID=A0A8H5GQ56_9AGAR|nr:hypothetical protein D9758_002952 [Tetrapyrgos nigripes]